MKRFIVSVLCVSVFFIVVGGLIEKVGAGLKSDEKALALLRRARQAIGGESAAGSVRSMTILGKATKTFEIENVVRSEQGDLEINLELPNRMSKMIKIGGEGAGGDQLIDKRFEIVMIGKGEGDRLRFKVEAPEGAGEGGKRIVIKNDDGTTEDVAIETKEPIDLRRSEDPNASADGKKVFVRKQTDVLQNAGGFHQNELLRTTLALLLTAPEGADAAYTYGGESSVDGFACDIIDAEVGGSSIKLYLDKSTSLPRMMTYQAMKPLMIKIKRDEADAEAEPDVKQFTRRLKQPEMAEFQVKFSDYRSVGGLQLPFRWTQTVGGKPDEAIDITSYEINPANISEKFKRMPAKVLIRTKEQQ